MSGRWSEMNSNTAIGRDSFALILRDVTRFTITLLGTVRAQPRFRSHVKSMGDFGLLQITNSNHFRLLTIFFIIGIWKCVFLSNNQDGIIQNYWRMHFLNATDVLANRVNCSGSTFNLTLFWRVVRDLCTLLCYTSPWCGLHILATPQTCAKGLTNRS